MVIAKSLIELVKHPTQALTAIKGGLFQNNEELRLERENKLQTNLVMLDRLEKAIINRIENNENPDDHLFHVYGSIIADARKDSNVNNVKTVLLVDETLSRHSEIVSNIHDSYGDAGKQVVVKLIEAENLFKPAIEPVSRTSLFIL